MGRELTWPPLSKLPLDVMAPAPMGISSWRYRLHVLCAAIHASGSDESDSGAFRIGILGRSVRERFNLRVSLEKRPTPWLSANQRFQL